MCTCTDAGLDKHSLRPGLTGGGGALGLDTGSAALLITHLLSGRDVDKTFKSLNPRCINMDNMHMVNVFILGRGAVCF